jgi:hypothetical protein
MATRNIRARNARQLKNVIALVTRRNVECRIEFDWGNFGTPIPPPQTTPPPWVGNAIRHTSAPLLKWHAKLKANPGVGSFLEVVGAQSALTAILVGPSPSIRKDEKEVPAIGELREVVVAQLGKQTAAGAKKLLKAAKRIQKHSRPANPIELRDNLARLQEGASALVDAAGDFIGMSSRHQQLAHMLWFWWPELKRANNAREVRVALNEVGGEFSRELVEKLCSKFQMFAGRRGRPRAKKIGH